jgi:hypothetical protein
MSLRPKRLELQNEYAPIGATAPFVYWILGTRHCAPPAVHGSAEMRAAGAQTAQSTSCSPQSCHLVMQGTRGNWQARWTTLSELGVRLEPRPREFKDHLEPRFCLLTGTKSLQISKRMSSDGRWRPRRSCFLAKTQPKRGSPIPHQKPRRAQSARDPA